MRILGIDPGTRRVGYGLIRCEGAVLAAVEWGVLEIAGADELGAIAELGSRMALLIKRLKPDRAAVEKIYFAKNQKTAIGVAQARGVILFSLLKEGIPIRELQPGEIKRAVTNYGSADKRAVAKMVAAILGVAPIREYDDASDALAAAVAAAGAERIPLKNRG